MSFNFDRRTFLKGAGAVGAASLLAACGEKSNRCCRQRCCCPQLHRRYPPEGVHLL